MVQEKSFREDLFFRLSILTINIPALRHRENDVILLARYFIHKICSEMKWKPPGLSSEVCELIKEYSWPGNVRQLKNAMIYAVHMAQEGLIKITDLPEELKYNHAICNPMRNMKSLKEMEKIAIVEAMKYTGNNKNEVEKILGLSKTTLYRKLKEYSIEYIPE